MGCGSSGPGATTNTVTQTTSPPPQVLAAYQNLINRGTAVANQPLQQWQGPTIAGFDPTQDAAFNEIAGAQGSALPYINAASQYAAQGAAPVFPNVMQFNAQDLAPFQNPYTQQVTQATQNLFNEQNAEQFNQANAAAASAGAFGGDREAVLEGEMARQQQLAEAPTLANIEAQGFNTAAGLLGQQQQLQLQGMEGDAWRAANAAYQMGGLGNQAQNALLSGAAAELQAGTMGQQLQQEELNVPIEQFYQQQTYPFQTTQFLAGLTEGIAPGMGGTATTTSPGPNAIGQGLGLGMMGLGTAGMLGWSPFGAKRGGLVPHRDIGGLVPPSSSPQLQQLYQRCAQMPLEQLQRLAVMVPPITVQGQMIQRAMQAKRMAPAGTEAFPHAGAPGMPQGITILPEQPGHADGGLVPGRAGGGANGAVTFTGSSLAPQIHLHAGQGVAGAEGMTGPLWSPGDPYLGSPAGSGPTPTASTGPVASTALPADVISPAPPATPTRPAFPIPLAAAVPYRRGGLVPRYAGDDGETGAVPPMDEQTLPGGVVPARQAGAGTGANPWLVLMSAGAGMMASRNPSMLGSIGEGALAGLNNLGRQQQQIAQQQYRQRRLINRRRAEGAETRANGPHVDASGTAARAPRVAVGDTTSIVYPDGNVLDTGLANPFA